MTSVKTECKAVGEFDLKAVVFSHGWSDLPPFRVENENGTVSLLLHTDGRVTLVILIPRKNRFEVQSDTKLNENEIKALRWMFRLDDPLDRFYEVTEGADRPWVRQLKMGRLLRSQTVFEDLVKLILTTNCSWEFTRLMTDRLVNFLGKTHESGRKTFPTPKALASKREPFFRNKIRAGYRSPHFPTIGRAVASGRLDPERWRDVTIPTETVRKEILAVPGAGPYVADNLLRFLGRYDSLGLDSWARAKLKEMWKIRKNPPDKSIERMYKSFGDHRGLVLWCDLTRDWFESGDFRSWIRVEEVSGQK